MNKTILSFVAFMACLCAFGANVYTNSFVKDGVTYVQRGGLTVKDYVVTNVVPGSGDCDVVSVNGKTGAVVLAASDIDALPLVEDSNGEKTAVTIGIRLGNVGPYSLANGVDVTASGIYSHAEGLNTTASGIYSHAEGDSTTASGYCSHAEGFYATASGIYSHAEGYYATTSGDGSHSEGFYAHTKKQDSYAFAWNGDGTRTEPYFSHGKGTFNINPVGGLDGFYIGEQTLSQVISGAVSGKADAASVYTKTEIDGQVIAAENPTFSNAVLSVGLNIDTNSVAVLNEIAETFGGFPIEGTATTVGGLLAALAAAVAWLKKNKADQTALDDLAAKVDAANAALEEVA